jgi:FAD/FMN-containing dehydrogenase
VVKNVAGHAVHRLLCGSRGGLAAILEASLKLLPGPETRIALVFAMKDWELAEERRWRALPRLEPSFVTVLGARAAAALPEPVRIDAPFVAVVGIEEDHRWAAEQENAVAAALGPPALRLEGGEVGALLQSLADAEDQDGARLTLTSAHLTPTALGPFLARPEASRLVLHAPAGRLHWFPADEVATSLVLELHHAGFRVIETRGPVGYQEPIAPQAALAPLRERIQRALDPAGRLSPAAR